MESGKLAWLKRQDDAFKMLFENLDALDNHYATSLLAEILALDLNRHLEKNPGRRFVLFVDEYERVMEGGGTGRQWSDNRFDRTMRQFISETNGLLAIFFSRERLPWTDQWQEDLENNQHLLGGLSDKDADTWLKKVPVESDAVRAAMIRGAKETSDATSPVYPLMLDMQVEHWRALGPEATPEAFEVEGDTFDVRRSELVGRLLRDYDKHHQQAISILALTYRFDKTAFDFVNRKQNLGFSETDYDIFTRLSLFSNVEHGWIAPHRAIADAIVAVETPGTLLDKIELLITHFADRAQPRTPAQVTEDTEFCFLEAARLKRQQGFDGYAEWLSATASMISMAGRDQFLEGVWRAEISFLSDHGFDENSEDVRTLRLELSDSLIRLHRYDEAEAILRDIQDHLSASREENVVDIVVWDRIARCMMGRGEYAQALPFYDSKAMEYQRSFGTNSEQTLEACVDLANCFEELGQIDDALRVYQDALNIALAIDWDRHPQLAVILLNLARCHEAQGRQEDARMLRERALYIVSAVVADGDLHGAGLQHLVANALNNKDFAADIEDLYVRSLATKRAELGEKHPATASALNDLARFLLFEKRLSESISHAREALKIRQDVLGDGHPETGSSYDMLACCLLFSGMPGAVEEAEEQFVNAADILSATLGVDDPETMRVLRNLVQTSYILENYEYSEYVARSLFDAASAKQDADPKMVEDARNWLVKSLIALGRNDEALQLSAD
jgi:tetratricopeptide (TPR) repeat protein